MKDYQPYIRAWQERFKQESLLAAERKREARIVAGRIAAVLLQKYCLKEVYLFGSVIIPDKEFSVDSDIDLAVSGLPVDDYFRIWRELESLSEFKVDLIDLDCCSQEFRMKVLAEGRRYQIDEATIPPPDQRN